MVLPSAAGCSARRRYAALRARISLANNLLHQLLIDNWRAGIGLDQLRREFSPLAFGQAPGLFVKRRFYDFASKADRDLNSPCSLTDWRGRGQFPANGRIISLHDYFASLMGVKRARRWKGMQRRANLGRQTRRNALYRPELANVTTVPPILEILDEAAARARLLGMVWTKCITHMPIALTP
jgi:hypothetical protein